MTKAFPVPPDQLWQALTASLPVLTHQATWYEHDRRVEWVVDSTGFSWTQNMTASVDEAANGLAVLSFSGRSPYRSALGDSGRRERAFRALTDRVAETLAHPLTMTVEHHADDEFRWWNGHEWTVDPPPADGP